MSAVIHYEGRAWLILEYKLCALDRVCFLRLLMLSVTLNPLSAVTTACSCISTVTPPHLGSKTIWLMEEGSFENFPFSEPKLAFSVLTKAEQIPSKPRAQVEWNGANADGIIASKSYRQTEGTP